MQMTWLFSAFVDFDLSMSKKLTTTATAVLNRKFHCAWNVFHCRQREKDHVKWDRECGITLPPRQSWKKNLEMPRVPGTTITVCPVAACVRDHHRVHCHPYALPSLVGSVSP